MSKKRRPRDLGNDDFAIRMRGKDELFEINLRRSLHLTEAEDRAVLTRMIQRLGDFLDHYQ